MSEQIKQPLKTAAQALEILLAKAQAVKDTERVTVQDA